MEEIKKKSNIISYSSFLNINKDNDKLVEKGTSSINNEIYLNIDSKNYLKEESINEIESINDRINNFKESNLNCDEKEKELSKQELTKQIKKTILNKLYPKCEVSVKRISLLISRQIRSEKKLNKETTEEYIDYFFKLRHDIKYSDSLILTKEIFINIGYVLCYIYAKFSQFTMKESKGIKECITRIIEKNIDVLSDYFCDCDAKGIDPTQVKKTVVWKSLRKKYEIPPELIFLINMLYRINTLDINLEFDGENYSEEDIKLFTITILNINYIFPKLEQVNLNFIHNKLQFSLYKRYYTKISNLLNMSQGTLKKNLIKNHSLMYNIKWDFENDFNLEEYRKNKINKNKNIIKPIIYDDYSILCYTEGKNTKKRSYGKKRTFNSLAYNNNDQIFCSTDNLIRVTKKDKKKDNEKDKNKNEFKHNNKSKDKDLNSSILIKDFELISNDEDDNSSIKTSTKKKINNTVKYNNKKNIKNNKNVYIELLEKNSFIFDMMLMTIYGVTTIDSIKKLILISNDFYNRDLINYIKIKYEINIASIDNEFHILDLLNNKTNNLELLNIEINALDIMSFDKIMEIICKNESLNTLKLSFFSSDVSYFIITLFKAYEEIRTNDEIKEYVVNEGNNFTVEKLEEKIINDISQLFVDNLYLLFEIIKNKNNLEVLGLNFDLPNILINKAYYKIPILKLILNIIFLIDNNEFNNKNKIKKLTLLSPYTIFDNRLENNINEIFKDIRIYKSSNTLSELNLQFQFYNMNYIKNIISPNLIVLSIGDLDLITFNKLVEYLTTYNFSINSVLKNLSIKLLNKITSFNTEVKLILRKLFNIKIKTLLEIKLFTNIIIDNRAKYSYLLKILEYNWVPSYTIILNEKSDNNLYSDSFDKNNILFLASSTIENIILKDSIAKIKKRVNNNQKNDINDEIFWILKYLFSCRYSCYSLSFFEIQHLSFTILKYLYCTSNIELYHHIKEERK